MGQNVPKKLHKSAPNGAKKSPKKRQKHAKKLHKCVKQIAKQISKKRAFSRYFAIFSTQFRGRFRRLFGLFWMRGAARLAQRPPAVLRNCEKRIKYINKTRLFYIFFVCFRHTCLLIFAGFCDFLCYMFLVFFGVFFVFFRFFGVFLASFFVAFLTHFWRFLRACLTSFCGPGSGSVAGSTPQRGTLAGLILVHICGSCGCPFFAELCPARRGRKSPRSTKVFTQKKVPIFLKTHTLPYGFLPFLAIFYKHKK